MDKKGKIIGIIIAIVVLIIVVIFVGKKIGKNNGTTVSDVSDLSALIDQIYEKQDKDSFPMLNTIEVDVSDADMVKMMTGLDDGTDLESIYVSEPMMSSIAYSLVLAKVKSGVDANSIAKDMSEQIDPRKWICVSAEKIYSTSSGDLVFLVMSDEEKAKPVYDEFKQIVGKVGKEYEKTE